MYYHATITTFPDNVRDMFGKNKILLKRHRFKNVSLILDRSKYDKMRIKAYPYPSKE